MNGELDNCARFAATPLDTGGTGTAAWASADPLPAMDFSGCRALVVVGAHPDDETLGFGATSAYLASRGIEVRVVSASDGDAAHPGASTSERSRLAYERRIELEAAIRVLGLTSAVSLGLPDGRLADHESVLTGLLTDILANNPAGTWCAATWRGDGHPDHEAVGRAAATAAAATGVRMLEYPVWMWHWARPGDPAVPWDLARRAHPPKAFVDRKARAAQCFRSQFEPTGAGCPPVLPAVVLRRLLAVGEMVFSNPDAPPVAGI
ncbi:PIG-L family deacetylase [Mycobacterium hackensackense]|uniref:PIG-L deacetylase family protein n=1 Tax=Mycobacterium hackensackense TaxID=228909 RepID=UPI002265F62C|nr:PIG-L family deacetylase [Mycobacterium hackensackense]MCV7252917.1 PIG-L family deacetylase [Mycobacterium hackensackense]